MQDEPYLDPGIMMAPRLVVGGAYHSTHNYAHSSVAVCIWKMLVPEDAGAIPNMQIEAYCNHIK